MGAFIESDDLTPFASISSDKADAMIEDAEAMAKKAAPCITDAEFAQGDVVKAILRRAILRWHDAGSGSLTTQTAGPFSQSVTTTPSRMLFWPSEIAELQTLCEDGLSGAFSVDTVGVCNAGHADVCSLNFGAQFCSCGVVLTGLFPLWEV